MSLPHEAGPRGQHPAFGASDGVWNSTLKHRGGPREMSSKLGQPWGEALRAWGDKGGRKGGQVPGVGVSPWPCTR